MNKIKLKQLVKEYEELKIFLLKKEDYTEKEILGWVAKCVVFFTDIKLNREILASFIKVFEIEDSSINGKDLIYSIDQLSPARRYVRKIGPYIFVQDYYGHTVPKKYNYVDSDKLSYVRIAFVSAKSILDKGLEDEKLVPNFLIKELKKEDKYSHIRSSLELIEQAYQDGDPYKLCEESRVLLESITSLSEDLRGKSLGGRMEGLIKEERFREKFGVDKDFIKGLNHGRIIRNENSHKDMPRDYNIPFLVAISFAHLVILFFEITLSTGELIKN